jgi:hypothetical protein
LRREFETLGVRANARRFDRAIYQRFKSEFDVLELQAAALNACEIKNVINQAEQRLPVVGDDVEELMMFRVERRFLEQLGHPEDGIQRRPDFVGHARKEFRLGARRVPRRFARGHQFRSPLRT